MSGLIVNGRFLSQGVTGVQRFAREVSAAAQSLGLWGADDYLVPGAAALADVPGSMRPQAVGRLTGHAWEQFELGRAAPAGGRLLLNLCNSAPVYRREQLVVLHDVAFVARPQHVTWRFRAWYRAMVAGYLRSGARVATVSAFSRAEIARCFRYPAQRITVVPGSGEHILAQPADHSVFDGLGLDGRPFVLAVSSRVPNKNFAAVARAAADPALAGVPFLIAGGAGHAGVFGPESVRSPHTRLLGYVSDARLRALYERAACFVFPSFYEGFGLPVLEAMACGCPVVASCTSSIPEVAGDAALLVDPADPQALARAVARVLHDDGLRRWLSSAGRARASRFTWARAARRLGELATA